MAVVKVKELFKGRRSSMRDGLETHVRVFRVETDDIADGTAAALTADDGTTAVPDYYAAHPVKTATRLTNKDAAPVNGKEDVLFDVTCEYTQPEFTDAGDDDPLQRPDEVSWGGSEQTEAYFRDVNDKIVATSAGEAFAEFLERDGGVLTVEVTRNVSTGDPGNDESYNRTVNSGTVTIAGTIFGAGTLKMKPVRAVKHHENGVTFYRKTYTMEAKREGWKDLIEDRGLNETDGSGNLTPIKDANGFPVKQPWPLDGAGAAKANATDTPETIEFEPYEEKDWSAIF